VDKKDVELLKKRNLFVGFNKVDSYELRFKKFNGSWSQIIEREVFDRSHGVLVVLFDAIKDKVILVEQFRCGAYAASSSCWFKKEQSPWTLECVAGNIGNQENPIEVAFRETKEETGCEIKDLMPIGHFLVSPSSSTQSVFMYCANVNSSKVKGVHGNSEEGEETIPIALLVSEAFNLMQSGYINTAGTIIGLQWLKLNYEDLINRWK
tara:strand:- start:274 stop:897 length:624 start_codon:yes stop_codon:yes gene_type:complete